MVAHGCTLKYADNGDLLIGGAAASWNDKRFNALCSQLLQHHREVRAIYDEYPALAPIPARPPTHLVADLTHGQIVEVA
jgi:hypothetical protein